MVRYLLPPPLPSLVFPQSLHFAASLFLSMPALASPRSRTVQENKAGWGKRPLLPNAHLSSGQEKEPSRGVGGRGRAQRGSEPGTSTTRRGIWQGTEAPQQTPRGAAPLCLHDKPMPQRQDSTATDQTG